MSEIKVINPKPSFVIKSKLLAAFNGHPPHTKIFLNVLTDPLIPQPDSDFNPPVTFPLIMENKWEIPIYITTDTLKTVLDKKGSPSLYINCIINDTCMRWCLLNRDLFTILMEWCIESIEFQFGEKLAIDRESITTPKLSYKGDSEDVVDLNVDLSAITSVNKNFLSDGDDDAMAVDTSEPKGIIEMKRLEAEAAQEEDEQELVSIDELLGKKKITNGTKPLIEIIEDMRISPVPEKSKPQKESPVTAVDKEKPQLRVDVTMSKLTPAQTKDSYKILIKFKSATTLYDLSFNSSSSELYLTTTDTAYSTTKSLVKIPLPEDIEGIIKSFLNEENLILYVYIK